MGLQRWRTLVAGLWAGGLLALALLAAPAALATLTASDAERLIGRWLAWEANASLALGIMALLLERVAARRAVASASGRQFSIGMMLALGAVFCTVAGSFAVWPMIESARAGQGSFTPGQLQATSLAFSALKLVLVMCLAWRNAGSGNAP